MARPKPWLGRIDRILNALEEATQLAFTRREVEEIFGIGRSAALELMGIAGKSRQGDADAVPRLNLIAYLKHSPEGAAASQEAERRKKVARAVNVAAEDAKLRAISIPGATTADEWAQMRDVPNVSIENGLFRCVFTDFDDLMLQLYRFAKAAGNDADFVRTLCEVRRT